MERIVYAVAWMVICLRGSSEVFFFSQSFTAVKLPRKEELINETASFNSGFKKEVLAGLHLLSNYTFISEYVCL